MRLRWKLAYNKSQESVPLPTPLLRNPWVPRGKKTTYQLYRARWRTTITTGTTRQQHELTRYSVWECRSINVRKYFLRTRKSLRRSTRDDCTLEDAVSTWGHSPNKRGLVVSENISKEIYLRKLSGCETLFPVSPWQSIQFKFSLSKTWRI